MIELCNDSKILYKRILNAKELLKNTNNYNEKIALYNYIENVYKYISIVDKKELCKSKNDIYGGFKSFRKYVNKVISFDDEMVDNYILNKDYISNYFKKIVYGLDTFTPDIINYNNKTFQELNNSDFNDILYQFMSSINLDSFFDKYFKNNKIYKYGLDKEESFGAVLYNPINKDTNILIGDFNYDLYSLFSVVHEFGHVYDLTFFNKDVNSYNNYFYKSFYGEVCSKLFERLFFNFMINNNILKDEAKVLLFETEDDNYFYIFKCYITSLLNDDLIISDQYIDLSSDEIYNETKKYFDYKVISYLDGKEPFNLQYDYTYAYGDIISMFLFDSINRYGFNNDLINEFIDERDKLFRKEFFEGNGLSSDNYIELYKKELKLLKK